MRFLKGLQRTDGNAKNKIGALQIRIGVELHVDGHLEVFELEVLGGTYGGHVAGEGLTIHPVAACDFFVLSGFRDDRFLMGGASTLHGCDASTDIPVETSGTERHAQFDIGGESTTAVNFIVIAIEHGIGLQRAVLTGIADIAFQLVGTFRLATKIEIAVSGIHVSGPVIDDADVEAKEALAEGDVEVHHASVFLEWGAVRDIQ